MISGAHVMIFTRDEEADRAFLRDVLEIPCIDPGGGWLIYKLPPTEMGVHGGEQNDVHQLYFMCDDLDARDRETVGQGRACASRSGQLGPRHLGPASRRRQDRPLRSQSRAALRWQSWPSATNSARCIFSTRPRSTCDPAPADPARSASGARSSSSSAVPTAATAARAATSSSKPSLGLNTLIDFRYTQHFRANAARAAPARTGPARGGSDLVIKVPVGTQLLADDEDRTCSPT